MKCQTHNLDATGVCAHCGKAVCPSCSRTGAPGRVACSDACAQALDRRDRAIDMILGRDQKLASATATLFYACGIILILFTLYANWRYPQLRLAHLLAGIFGVAFLVFGVMYERAAKKKS